MNRVLVFGWVKVASGNLAAGVLRLIGLIIAARALGANDLGIIVLIEAYVRVVDGLLNFQSVNVMTRFLAEVDTESSPERFRGLVKAGLWIDGATAVATCLVAVIALPLVGTWIGIPSDWTGFGMLFCLVILTRVLGTAEAVLRCFDKFWAIGHRESVAGVIIVISSLVALQYGAGAKAFLFIWMSGEIVANVVFLAGTTSALRQRGIRSVRRGAARVAIRQSPGFWPMLWQTNVTLGVKVLTQWADLLIAGALLGQAFASLLRAAKSIAGAVAIMFGRPLQQVASAPIARLWAQGEGDALLRYTRNICLSAGAVGLIATVIFALMGDVVLSMLFGSQFAGADVTLVLLLLANTGFLFGVTLLPTMLALGLSKQFLYAVLWATAAYAMVLAVAVSPMGDAGIALAHVAFNAVWACYGWWWVVAVARKEAAPGE